MKNKHINTWKTLLLSLAFYNVTQEMLQEIRTLIHQDRNLTPNEKKQLKRLHTSLQPS